MSRVRKSVLLIFAENYSTLIIQFVSTLILVRLLTPAQIGIFSVTAVVVNGLYYFSDSTLLALGEAKNNMQVEFVRQPITVELILPGCSY